MFLLPKEGEAECLESWLFLGNSELMLGFPYVESECCDPRDVCKVLNHMKSGHIFWVLAAAFDVNASDPVDIFQLLQLPL